MISMTLLYMAMRKKSFLHALVFTIAVHEFYNFTVVMGSRIKLNLDLGELQLVQSELGFAGVRGTSFAINFKSGLTSVNVTNFFIK